MLKDWVVPQLIGQWLFVLGNACKQARLKQMKDWPEFVKAYHVLIAKLILSARIRPVYPSRKGGSDLLGRIGLVGGARLLQRQGTRYRLLDGRIPETYLAKGDHSGRPNLSPVVQQDPDSFAGAARAQGAGADSGLFD
jgi:hypothetical protein